jgi:hypothetical protein
MRDRLTIAQRESVRPAPTALDKIMSDYYRTTYPEPWDREEGPLTDLAQAYYDGAWQTVLDYMDGWAWPLWSDEEEAAIIASFDE